MIQTAEPRPRSIISILVIGLMLGPAFVMLWLGRGKWALLYLAAVIAVSVAGSVLGEFGIINTDPYLFYLSRADLVSVLALDAVGIVHAFRIRAVALARPWYRWIAIVPAWLIIILIPVRTFLFQPFNIPSASTFPNLAVGDYILVSKSGYGFSRFSVPFDLVHIKGRVWGKQPQRGDLAVFKLPTDTNVDYVKRIVGLPGDRIQMIDGVLNINGEPVKLEPVELAPPYHADASIRFLRETLPGGRSYVIANLDDNGFVDNTQEFAVPLGHYFALGDNRDNSQDSRFLNVIGYIPEENLIGPVVLRFWNSEGFPLDNRPEEFDVTE